MPGGLDQEGHDPRTRESRAWRVRRVLFGEAPRAYLLLLVPLGLALLLDFALRGGTIAAFWIGGKAIYFGSILTSAATWTFPLYLGARCFASLATSPRAARAGLAGVALFISFVAGFSFVGQAVYFRVFGSYVGRDTIRLGMVARGTVSDWFAAWSGIALFSAMILSGAAIAFGALFFVRKRSAAISKATPIFPAVLFCAALFCYWTDEVDSRYLQAALPDTCFVHGVIHAVRMKVTGHFGMQQGVSLRTPAPLPPLTSSRPRPPNVIVVLTESVRADAICSDPPPKCKDAILDPVAPDRIPIGLLTSQTPNTFSSCMILWTGLPPSTDFTSAHSAPMLWEIAKAVGYKTAYFTSQNPRFEDFGSYTRRAGIDTIVSATELGGLAQEQIGAPDEHAAARALAYVKEHAERERDTPLFLLLQFSNTHQPYRTDPSVQPFTPISTNPVGDANWFHNNYKNAVALQEKLLERLIHQLRELPTWDDTVFVFLSDHGEQFREHGGLYHNHSLYDEELRVPGFVLAGKNALTPDDRAGLASYAGRRVYMQDMNATLVDLFGVGNARASLPYSSAVAGRSVLRPSSRDEPTVFLSTTSPVWEPDEPIWGVMRGKRVAIAHPHTPFKCFDLAKDPKELAPRPEGSCGDLAAAANNAFDPKK